VIEDVGTQDRGWGWLNIAALLTEPYRSRLSLPQKIALLRCCRMMAAGNADGWTIQVEKTGVACADFEPAIERALDVLEGKPHLFPPMQMEVP
jgi:hypothetical protein